VKTSARHRQNRGRPRCLRGGAVPQGVRLASPKPNRSRKLAIRSPQSRPKAGGRGMRGREWNTPELPRLESAQRDAPAFGSDEVFSKNSATADTSESPTARRPTRNLVQPLRSGLQRQAAAKQSSTRTRLRNLSTQMADDLCEAALKIGSDSRRRNRYEKTPATGRIPARPFDKTSSTSSR